MPALRPRWYQQCVASRTKIAYLTLAFLHSLRNAVCVTPSVAPLPPKQSFSPPKQIMSTSFEAEPSSSAEYDLDTAAPSRRERRAAHSSESSSFILAMSSPASIEASLSRISSSYSSVNTSVTHWEKAVTSKSGGGPADSGASGIWRSMVDARGARASRSGPRGSPSLRPKSPKTCHTQGILKRNEELGALR